MAPSGELDSAVPGRPRAALLVALIVLGLGVAAAPAIFQMFDRAPKGGDMIDNFRPYMTKAEIVKFRGFLTEMREARAESTTTADLAAAAKLGLTPVQYAKHVQYLHAFEQQFPGIDRDMGDMLDRMERNLGNYRGVDALPPFALFPWFFVIPGLLIAGGAGVAFVARRRGRRSRGALVLVVVVGVGLVLAPAVFQMFTRGPGGGDMVRDFRPIMTREKLTTVQGYFLTIGNGEAELRNVVLPAAALPATDTTALTRFSADWPRDQPRDGAVRRRDGRQPRELRRRRRAPALRAVPLVLRDPRAPRGRPRPARARAALARTTSSNNLEVL